jgi:hypothetical protein
MIIGAIEGFRVEVSVLVSLSSSLVDPSLDYDALLPPFPRDVNSTSPFALAYASLGLPRWEVCQALSVRTRVKCFPLYLIPPPPPYNNTAEGLVATFDGSFWMNLEEDMKVRPSFPPPALNAIFRPFAPLHSTVYAMIWQESKGLSRAPRPSLLPRAYIPIVWFMWQLRPLHEWRTLRVFLRERTAGSLSTGEGTARRREDGGREGADLDSDWSGRESDGSERSGRVLVESAPVTFRLRTVDANPWWYRWENITLHQHIKVREYYPAPAHQGESGG